MPKYHLFLQNFTHKTFPIDTISHIKFSHILFQGSDYGHACPDAIQIKGSVCNSNGLGLVV